MLDIQKIWFIVLAVNFFGLLIILNYILFKPLLKIFKEREDIVRGSLDAAKDMNTKREETIAGLNRELAETRSKAKETFETLRSEGLQRQKEVLTRAEAEASAMLDKARSDIRAEVERARQTLRSEIDKFSDEIVRKLVKV
jgi:F-type H+-transporting ATPase subunit b